MSHAPVPGFSIITVCFNAQALIGETGRSLRDQTCSDYEWIVVDGASSDATLDAVRAVGIANTRISSKPDDGIYDAMNKGIAMARGEWIYFLNAGDSLADTSVLADITSQAILKPTVLLFFGDMLYVGAGVSQRVRFGHVRRASLVFDDLNHQAVFARRSLFESLGEFKLDFRTSADYDWLLRVFGSGAAVAHLPRLIGHFAVGGAHVRDLGALQAERRRIRRQYLAPRQLWLGSLWARVRRRMRLLVLDRLNA